MVAVLEGSTPVLVPLVLRTAAGLPWPAEVYGAVDAASPYGYGGPVPAPDDLCEVLRVLQSWAADRGLVSVFLRLSLDVTAAPPPSGPDIEVVEVMDNVVVRLQRPADEVWSGYAHKVRKNVRKALRAGCTVQRDGDFRLLDDFLDVYAGTMQRRDAAAWYRFDRIFFERIDRELAGCFSVFSVRDAAGGVVSVELVLESDRYLYSFLGGTRAEAFPIAPNDLLKHAVIEHGRATGRRGFVLGGGAAPGDGIFRYKRAFDPGGVTAFRAARLITDPARYARWTAERDAAVGATSNADFFPSYRRPPGG